MGKVAVNCVFMVAFSILLVISVVLRQYGFATVAVLCLAFYGKWTYTALREHRAKRR